MHSLAIVSVGKTKEVWLDQAWHEYVKRLKPYLKFQGLWLNSYQELSNYLQSHPKALLLDPEGEMLDSLQFHTKIHKQSQLNKGHLEIVIGPDCGFDELTKRQAHDTGRLLSLSRLTFTHQICRLLIIEQVYRSTQIERGSPYHK